MNTQKGLFQTIFPILVIAMLLGGVFMFVNNSARFKADTPSGCEAIAGPAFPTKCNLPTVDATITGTVTKNEGGTPGIVNIKVNSLTITGKIDVSGLGGVGGNITTPKGNGPHGGAGVTTQAATPVLVAQGKGGVYASGDNFGSGGGWANAIIDFGDYMCVDDETVSYFSSGYESTEKAGNGGGGVTIDANTVSGSGKILAKGTDGSRDPRDADPLCSNFTYDAIGLHGGGSGGLISITASTNTLLPANISFVGGIGGKFTGNGTNYTGLSGTDGLYKFTQKTVAKKTLSVTVNGTGSGSVNSNPSGIVSCTKTGGTCNADYATGDTVVLTATENSSNFTGWTVPAGTICTGTGPCTVTMDASKSVTATFTANATPPTATISLTATPSSLIGAGTTSLHWDSTSTVAGSCVASSTPSGYWSGSGKATSGTETSSSFSSGVDFTITCNTVANASNGPTIYKTINVPVTSQPTLSATLDASPATITGSGSTTLTWTTQNAASCTSSSDDSSSTWTGNLSNLNSNKSVVVNQTTKYTLFCTGVPNSNPTTITKEKIVSFNQPPAPTVTLSISKDTNSVSKTNPPSPSGVLPSPIQAGDAVNIIWSSTDAVSCSGNSSSAINSSKIGGWDGTLDNKTPIANGSQNNVTGFEVGNNTISYTCFNSVGVSTGVTITVKVASPPAAASLYEVTSQVKWTEGQEPKSIELKKYFFAQ